MAHDNAGARRMPNPSDLCVAKERWRGSQRITPDGEPAECPTRCRWVGVDGEPMQTEFYRVIYWVGIAALVVWTVYSAYSAISFS
jgi:hypothetical protein